jgi:hypothetical protein
VRTGSFGPGGSTVVVPYGLDEVGEGDAAAAVAVDVGAALVAAEDCADAEPHAVSNDAAAAATRARTTGRERITSRR